jgi:pimeloyl-ACP methyl ester carboxylesterase
MTPHLKTATLSTGVRLPYVEQGDPAGVPVILLHGSSDSWRSWELLLPRLPASLHAYAITQRGHGDADRPRDGYRPEDQAADVAAFMDAVGLEESLIVGHSAGSYTARRFALDHPQRTLGLVLIGAFRAFHDNPGVLELWQAVAQLTDPVDPAFVREFQESCAARPLPDGFLEQVIAESCKLPARVWKAHVRGLLEADVPTDTGTITAPTLILWGDKDAFCPRSDQDALLAAIPGSELVVYPGTGHCPHWEQVERVAAELTAFTTALPADRALHAARQPG